MSLRIRRGDKVVVLAGKDKGKRGVVLKVFPKRERAVVEGVNLVKKHLRRRSEAEPGGVKEIPSSIHLSNLAVICPNCNRGVRWGVKILEDGSKIRICKRCNRQI